MREIRSQGGRTVANPATHRTVGFLAVRQQSSVGVTVREGAHYPRANAMAARCSGHLDEWDLLGIVSNRRHIGVSRVDSSELVELDPGYLNAHRKHLDE